MNNRPLGFWPPFSRAVGFWCAFIQVEAGKGLEMRKLVLSGFLASEEIYINQLEALLLVSVCAGASSLSAGPCHGLELLLELERKEDLNQSFPVGGACGTALIPPSVRQPPGSFARKGLRLSAPTLHYLSWERQEKQHDQVGGANTPSFMTMAQTLLSHLSRWGPGHHLHTVLWESVSQSINQVDLVVIPDWVLPSSWHVEPFMPSHGLVAGNVRGRAVCAILRNATALRH